MKHKRLILTVVTVSLLSIATVGSVFAETETNINSKGKILTSSDEVLFDSSDFKILADKIDGTNESLNNLFIPFSVQISANMADSATIGYKTEKDLTDTIKPLIPNGYKEWGIIPVGAHKWDDGTVIGYLGIQGFPGVVVDLNAKVQTTYNCYFVLVCKKI